MNNVANAPTTIVIAIEPYVDNTELVNGLNNATTIVVAKLTARIINEEKIVSLNALIAISSFCS